MHDGPSGRDAFRDSLPVLFGYLPLGCAFGVLFSTLGYHWLYAPLAGLIIYAGSAQFLAVALLGAGAGLIETFVATLLLNARHVFYGLSVLDRYPRAGFLRWYLIFGLTDETYALVTAKPRPRSLHSTRYYAALTGLNHGYWVLGCALGAGLQEAVSFDPAGFEFTLVALFAVLLIEQFKRLFEPLLVGLVAVFAVGLSAWLGESFLLPACALAVGLVTADAVRGARA